MAHNEERNYLTLNASQGRSKWNAADTAGEQLRRLVELRSHEPRLHVLAAKLVDAWAEEGVEQPEQNDALRLGARRRENRN